MLEAVPGFEALDIGAGKRAKLAIYAQEHGWKVTAIDITYQLDIPGIQWYQEDLNKLVFRDEQFRLILNISSIEHFGIPGRYGIKGLDLDADLRAMDRVADWLSPAGQMIVTLPVGPEAILAPFHRVYGPHRLDKLFDKYDVVDAKFWNKQGNVDTFRPCSAGTAFTTQHTLEPSHYYAIGGFILEKTL